MSDPLSELDSYLESVDAWNAIAPDGEDQRDEDTHAAALALQELKRRAAVEKRLDEWLSGEDGDLRSVIRSLLGVKLKNYRTGKEWFAGPDQSDGADDHWSWTDAAIDAAEAP
jgi:hypothetical protein